MFINAGKSSCQWEGYTLILPAISVGNVGQLTADLLISTLQLDSVGHLHDESILPLCGNDPYASTGVAQGVLVTSAEVYECKEKELVIIQQRAPLVKGKQRDFRKKLLAWIKECKFSQVVLLSSTHSHERVDSQITGSPFRFLSTASLSISADDLKWQRLETREDMWGVQRQTAEETIPEEAKGVYIPGGGMAKRFFEDCCREQVPLAVLMVFCSEGDNIPDAMMLVSELNKWIKVVQEAENQSQQQRRSPWKKPKSWDLLYGSAVESSLY
ncbi:proteasome assembly chaperone 2-like [Amphiura filiformis]|uniref:proteasome assembly chaperone 2-like n=1 Tax=Amphiura filiformis TaxID=82378 RepID=UPI003B21A3DC